MEVQTSSTVTWSLPLFVSKDGDVEIIHKGVISKQHGNTISQFTAVTIVFS